MNNPLRMRQMSVGLILLGAILAGLGDGIRASADHGEASWTFLLDVVGLLLALGGAVLEARTADLMFAFAPIQARQRALLRLVAGLVVALLSCLLIGVVDEPIPRAVVGAVLIAGAGFGAGGLFSLAWHYGGAYAADRIQDRANDDWR